MFSSNLCSFVVPGIGTIQGLRARSHPIAICAAVAFFAFAINFIVSTTGWFAARFPGERRGFVFKRQWFQRFKSLFACPSGSPINWFSMSIW